MKDKELKNKVFDKLVYLQKIEKVIDGLYFTWQTEETPQAKRLFNELLKDLKTKLKKEIRKI